MALYTIRLSIPNSTRSVAHAFPSVSAAIVEADKLGAVKPYEGDFPTGYQILDDRGNVLIEAQFRRGKKLYAKHRFVTA